ncbi:hypothetical protein K2173_012672 [Erythroxylum novogranatense]|uniref:GH10 domain-containing protein n=1 Tax=Erythroxylum novogranatense TaxID=1862640 RepID=A0AAV8TJK6_9ROSI|nr:hypothetical protein K2173_012672 [Erythroxylum novogranatense]
MVFLGNNNHFMQQSRVLGFLVFSFLAVPSLVVPHGPAYDHTAYTECKAQPEEPLYKGGVLKDQIPHKIALSTYSHGLILSLHNASEGIYSFSTWVKIDGVESTMVTASLSTNDNTIDCVGNVLAKHGCWSFLKGGFVLNAPSKSSAINFKSSASKNIDVAVASTSLQRFTETQWRKGQHHMIDRVRKRAAMIHVTDSHGQAVKNAKIRIEQMSKSFPFGSAIASTILGNQAYQKWFLERFNAAVFENELKWYATEPEQGKINYSISDKMLEFVQANRIVARGHNIFWEDPRYNPGWVKNLTGAALKSAVNARIQSLMNKYKEQFIHWDVSNEMLHFDFYEQELGPDASLQFYLTAHKSDPLATLFLNEYNVVETCSDSNSTADTYIARIKELKHKGVSMNGIGLEGHFSKPNLPLMRAILDKLATLRLPIWLTEVDISNKFDQKTQATYLDQVLREGFSHPAVDGIMLWTALHSYGCYQMCLTDNNLKNLPAGDVVDRLLRSWRTGNLRGQSDGQGAYSFVGFFGEYKVSVQYGNRTANSTFSLCPGDETKYVIVQV